MTVLEELQEWPVVGEVPAISEPELRAGAAAAVATRALSLARQLKDDHEVSTTINDNHISLITIEKTGHKKEIAAVAAVTLSALSVAGLLAARHHTRIKHTKK